MTVISERYVAGMSSHHGILVESGSAFQSAITRLMPKAAAAMATVSKSTRVEPEIRLDVRSGAFLVTVFFLTGGSTSVFGCYDQETPR